MADGANGDGGRVGVNPCLADDGGRVLQKQWGRGSCEHGFVVIKGFLATFDHESRAKYIYIYIYNWGIMWGCWLALAAQRLYKGACGYCM